MRYTELPVVNVGIDYRSALRPNLTGVGRYVRDLVASLPAVGADQCYILLHDEGRCVAVPSGAHLRQRSSQRNFRRNGMRQLWEEAWLPATIAHLGIDVYHGPHAFLPYILPRRLGTVVTVHDVIHCVLPETIDPFFRMRLDMGVRHAVRHADVIIADSHSTAKDITKYYGIPSDAMTVVPLGVPSLFSAMPMDAARRQVRDRFGVCRPYLLYNGGFGVRKNVLMLLRVYAALRNATRDDLDFVVVGDTGRAGELLDFARRAGLQDLVHFPGYVADEELVPLYSAATVFAYPSLYEGFGLPVLEAMTCGVPVVCSNTSSLPEAAGDAALLVTPTALDDWVGALRRVVESPNCQAALRAAGWRQAACFSLKAEVATTRELYAKARAKARQRIRS